MTRILLVDDDRYLVRALVTNLRARGYEVDTARDGATALAAAVADPPDVVVVDLGLPDLDGVEVIRGIRTWSSAPIIVLSARHDETVKVDALDSGADDYVTKPFGMDEFLARLRAADRRRVETAQSPVVRTDHFLVDLASHTATVEGAVVRLTPTEWHLLEVLVRHSGRLVGQRELLQEVWGPAYGTESHYLRLFIAQLRRKLEPEPSTPRYILTEPGMGYRFTP
jgi:two-component system, OmpR family, KDP operon response regulator KdpE